MSYGRRFGGHPESQIAGADRLRFVQVDGSIPKQNRNHIILNRHTVLSCKKEQKLKENEVCNWSSLPFILTPILKSNC